MVVFKADSDILKLRAYLKTKISTDRNGFADYSAESEQIYKLLERTVNSGESNSALVIGPRNSGKTSIVNDVVSKLTSLETFHNNALLVRLNGLIHTDDRLALVAATTQMNLEAAVDGKVFLSFAENLSFLLASLRSGDKSTSKSIIFILEEFDLFCSHHNQTLLYNLFDVSQSAQAPICVLGVTCRYDVIELLEKRVKSRFSHRQYFLFPPGSTALKERLERVEFLLTISDCKDLSSTVRKIWNKHIKDLLQDKKVKAIQQRVIDLSLNEDVVKNTLVLMINTLGPEKDLFTVEDFENWFKEYEKDEIVDQIQDLSVLELCLLISMKHHYEIYDKQPMNFEMIYTRYLKFAGTTSNLQNVQRAVVMKAFEHLQACEFIQGISGTTGKLQKEYKMFKLLITPQQIMDAVKVRTGLPTEVAQWAGSSII